MVEYSFMSYMLVGSCPVPVTLDIAPVSSKEFLDIQATIECGFTLKRVCDMIKTYNRNKNLDKKINCNKIVSFQYKYRQY